MSKLFNSKYHQEYYKDWVYLGNDGEHDYYFQGLPTEDKAYPSTSIVFGESPNEYVSTTHSVEDILDNEKCNKIVLFAVLANIDIELHLVAYIRRYALLRGYNL
jgi:hypothetical protein